jgi:hypothetical protein
LSLSWWALESFRQVGVWIDQSLTVGSLAKQSGGGMAGSRPAFYTSRSFGKKVFYFVCELYSWLTRKEGAELGQESGKGGGR